MPTISEQKLIEATEKAYQKAEVYYGRTFRRPKILFNLRGATAGIALANPLDWHIKYNIHIFEENQEDFLQRTVPHEVAHLLVAELYSNHFRRVKPHGIEWKNVCHNIGMKNVTRCHSYDVSNHVRRHQRPYTYKCDCKEHSLTPLLHRRIQAGRGRICVKCKAQITFVGSK